MIVIDDREIDQLEKKEYLLPEPFKGTLLQYLNKRKEQASCNKWFFALSVKQNKVAGFLFIENVAINTWYLVDIYVCDEYRKQHIGQQLLFQSFELLKKNALYPIMLTCDVSQENLIARKFFQNHGFRPMGSFYFVKHIGV